MPDLRAYENHGSKLGALALAALTSALGCDGEVLHVGDHNPTVAVPPELLARCPSSNDATRRYETDEEVREGLRGRWFRCRGQEVGALYGVGIEFTDTGWWYGLDEVSGGVARSSGNARFGTYSPYLSAIQFAYDSGAPTQTVVPLFDDSGTRMVVAFSSYSGPVDIAYVHE